MTPDDKPAKREKGDDLDLLRDVLDWMPADVLMEEADPEDLELLASIDERLDRTIVEQAREGAAEPEDEDLTADATEDEEGPADQAPEAEPAEDPATAELDEPPTPPTTEEAVPTQVEHEPGEITSLTIEEEPEPEPEQDEPRVEVVVAEAPEDEDEAADEEPISLAPPVEPAASGPGGWDAYGALSPFTVVAPPQGSVSGDWIVPGEEQIQGGEIDRLSEGIDSELDVGGIGEDAGAWPEEDLFDDDLEKELDEDFPGLEDDLGEDLDDDLEGDLFEDEALAEAEPEQDADAWEAPDEEEAYWESLLEDEGEPQGPPAFEAEEDWESAAEAQPAQAEASEPLADQPPADIPIEAPDEEDPFADLWDEDEEVEPAPPAQEQEAAPLTFELDEPDEEPAQATEEDEEELAFEEVSFELAAEPEPEPEPEPEEAPAAAVATTPEFREDDPFGDVHPVTDVEGIGETYEAALAGIGIHDTRELWYADADAIAEAADVSPKVARRWQQMSELIALPEIGPQYAELLVRSGVTSVEELAHASAGEVVEGVEAKQQELDVQIQGNIVREGRATRWINVAREHLGLAPLEPAEEGETEAAWPEQTVEDEPEAEAAPPPEREPLEEEDLDHGEQEAVEEEAPDLDEAVAGEPYTHGPYTLYHKVVETGDGDTRDLYFFARSEPEDATAADLPQGYEVGVNERTGVPFVRRERG